MVGQAVEVGNQRLPEDAVAMLYGDEFVQFCDHLPIYSAKLLTQGHLYQ